MEGVGQTLVWRTQGLIRLWGAGNRLWFHVSLAEIHTRDAPPTPRARTAAHTALMQMSSKSSVSYLPFSETEPSDKTTLGEVAAEVLIESDEEPSDEELDSGSEDEQV